MALSCAASAGPSVKRARAKCLHAWAWHICRTGPRGYCRAASSSAWRWRAPGRWRRLDPGAAQAVEEIVLAMAAEGTKIVMTTHNLGQARRIGDEIVFVHKGRIAERATVDAFFRTPATPEAAAFLKGELPW
jgi:hypothetical protein